MKQLADDPWATDIPKKYSPGQIVKGPVTKITNFGVFVELEEDLEGLLHVSELADHKVENPQEVVKVGDEIEVKILRVDTDERKIGLSLKRAQWAAEETGGGEGGPGEPVKRRGGLEGEGGLLGEAQEQFLKTARQREEAARPQRETPKSVDKDEADRIALDALGEEKKEDNPDKA